MLSKRWVIFSCQWWLFIVLNLIAIEKVKAQVIPDATLGSESSIVNSIDNLNERIAGGARRGVNLFHSFKEFNIGEGRGVFFANPDGIANIFSRITGDNPSNIFGKLGVSGAANLFLINPNGIVFGEKASLDVQGSFVATTADAIRFGEKDFFSASEPQEPSQLLTVNPSAFLFNQIANQPINSIESQASFSLSTEKNLLLVGGNVILEGGNLIAPGGRIELGSVSGSGVVDLNQTEQGWVLGYDSVKNFGDIKLSQSAFVDTSGAGGGSIQVQAHQLLAETGSIISANTNGDKDGGDIFIRTTEAVTVDDSAIGTFVEANASGDGGNILIETKRLDVIGGILPFGGFISSSTGAQGKSGDLIIKAEQVSLTNGGEIQADTFSSGDAGNISIQASEFVEVIGNNPDGNLSNISTQVNRNASGKGGQFSINTKRLTIKDGAQLQAGTFSEVSTGQGGTLSVNASESVEISGTNGGRSPSGLFTATFGAADTGDLTINTRKLRVNNGGTVSASTAGLLGEGKSGNLTINATDSVEVTGSLKEDEDTTFFSSLVAETGRLLATNTGINPAPGGNLTINTEKLTINDGGKVSSATYGFAGTAGDLTVNARESVEVSGNQSRLSAKTNGTGDAGNLTIRTQKLTIRESAEVSTSTGTANNALRTRVGGKGGILDIEASDFVEVSGVDTGIVSLSTLSTGDAGKVKINTGRLFIRDGATVSTSSIGRGRGGDLEINASDFIEISGSDISFVDDIPFARKIGFDQFVRQSSLSSVSCSAFSLK